MALILMIGISQAQEKASDLPALKGPYLGQKPPGMTPEVFAPGFISTEERELNSVFTPDGKEFYFTRPTPEGIYSIWLTQEGKKGWTKPELATFNSKYTDVDMCVSPDGQRLFWGSTRPVNGEPLEECKIWYVVRQKDGWSEPKFLEGPVNSAERALYPTLTKDETMYFQSLRPGSFGRADIYRSQLVDGVYQEPENLGPTINSENHEGDVLIAPDESYIIVSTRRPHGFGRSDLFISFKKESGSWAPLANMGELINSEGTEYCPMLSPDGKYLFYTSTRTGKGDIYWVDAKIIEELKPDDLK
jgi:hypothetical protein